MAETVITSVLSKCREVATQEILREAKVLLQVGEDIMLLRDRLEWLQAFVRDADRKRRVGADDLTRIWVRQTRDVVFQAEDVLDEFFHKVIRAFRQIDIESKLYQGPRKWLAYLTDMGTQITVRHWLSSQINKIKSRLDQISKNQKEFNIGHTPSGIWTSANTDHTDPVSWEELQKVVGFEKDVERLVELLRREDHPQKMFISILGESGVGKYRLIKQTVITVSDSFNIVVQFIMPRGCSVEDALREVYRIALDPTKRQGSVSREAGIADVVKELRLLLADKRYLLILVGVSSKIFLNCMAASLPDGKRGSWVLLVLEPESKEVACHAATLNLKDINGTRYQLGRLDKEKSGHLFRCRVFGSQGEKLVQAHPRSEEENQMERYEKDVHNITGGHPLAIVVLAGLLRSKERPLEWDAVLQHFKPGTVEEETEDGGGTKDKSAVEWLHKMMTSPAPAEGEPKLSKRMAIERIFSSSFDDLPQDIKLCFLYFAAYPKDVLHRADHIVRMWTAEGFIRPCNGKTMEELGQLYLQELVSRSLLEWQNINCCGGFEKVRVHNRLLVFLQSEAREASFIEVVDSNDVLAPASVRRLSIDNESGSLIRFTNKFPKLRSFICRISEQVQGNKDKKQSQGSGAGQGQEKKQSRSSRDLYDLKFLRGSKFLRVLSMEGSNLTELPDEIGDMIHLRYLRVACTHLKNLPSSIKKLLNLQTLDISGTDIDKIDQDFWLIKTLRHVLARKLKLPASVGNMKELDDLQTLHGVQLSKQGEDMQPHCGFSKPIKPPEYPLDMMTRLRSLEICGFNHTDHATALESALGNMHLLGH
ncbi:putative disease resistance protein At1g50180 [Brachypodium distachyon]|uniref:putative disease resistance protein At1g50180 n=1 Tax=Brachypodium distachyon TaxID=15368 RepID=UPI000D0CC554|nr:putative disease resistance protein At1g50180 [Brachypodium distachyon]|eukprot:XP_024310387.1 putative disease resistance protein At1g50180 [Brachypodium distachyon]